MNAQIVSTLVRENPEQVARGHEQLRTLLERSATDMAFRRGLLTDPHATIAGFTGETIPADYRIAFVENAADVTVVLPNVVDQADELSETDLQAVAGGSEPVAIGLAIFAASMALSISIARS